MTDFESLQKRVAALEFVLEEILPMLIQDAPYYRDIQQTLFEWQDETPAKMQENEAFPLLVDALSDGLPDAHP